MALPWWLLPVAILAFRAGAEIQAQKSAQTYQLQESRSLANTIFRVSTHLVTSFTCNIITTWGEGPEEEFGEEPN